MDVFNFIEDEPLSMDCYNITGYVHSELFISFCEVTPTWQAQGSFKTARRNRSRNNVFLYRRYGSAKKRISLPASANLFCRNHLSSWNFFIACIIHFISFQDSASRMASVADHWFSNYFMYLWIGNPH
jgi:hypothetical protein